MLQTNNIKVGTLLDTSYGYVFVLDIYDDFHFCGIDFETQQKTYLMDNTDIKNIVYLPDNVRYLWIKRMNNILGVG